MDDVLRALSAPTRREGVRRWYRARPERLDQVRAYLDQFWGDRLEDLRVAAEAEHSTGWDHYLPRLAETAEGRDPGPDPWAQA
jgi:hypothetical protein